MGADSPVVTMTNVAPIVDAGENQTVDAGQVVTFTGAFTDPGTLDTDTILWTFGDGNAISGTLTPTHTFTIPEIYTVTLIVTDDDGGVGEDTLQVTVEEPPVVEHKLFFPLVVK